MIEILHLFAIKSIVSEAIRAGRHCNLGDWIKNASLDQDGGLLFGNLIVLDKCRNVGMQVKSVQGHAFCKPDDYKGQIGF